MHYRGLDLNLLVVFDSLVAEKNITRTGERIYLSQSATSGALARLRAYFDDDLLVQVGDRKMALTPLAEHLAPRLREVLLQIERLIDKGPDFNPATSTRKLRLMMSDYVASVLMPRVLPRVQERAPGITFELLSNAEHPLEFLERGEVDMLFMPEEYISKLHPAEELFRDGYVCMVWNQNPLIGDEITVEQYRHMGHVGIRLGNHQMQAFDERYLCRIGFERRIEVVSMTFDLFPRLLTGSTRIATVPERLGRSCADHYPVKLVPVPIPIPPLREFAQWHKYRETDPAIIWFRDILREVAGETVTAKQQERHPIAGPGRLLQSKTNSCAGLNPPPIGGKPVSPALSG
jgi:DNA-binding transcriptional LysR family regulator